MSERGNKTAAWMVGLSWLGAVASWSADPGARHTAARAATAPVAMAMPSTAPVSAGMRRIIDVAYGDDPLQRYDVYVPPGMRDAPIVLMVHGGGWRFGDKAMANVVDNKVARWVARGFIVVSTNYRLLPQADLHAQLDDVVHALASVQRRAGEWGGDGHRIVLMGHSAGAHLVALLAARPALAYARGAAPWLGTVVLDSATMDVPATMQWRHPPLYDRAFGNDPKQWNLLSPLQQLQGGGAPILAVCSLRRLDACPQARRFAASANALGTRAEVLVQDLSHAEINRDLGIESAYTRAIEAFLAGLDSRLAKRLASTTADSASAGRPITR